MEGRVNVSSDAILDKGQSTSRGPTVWGRTRVFALCLALVAAAPPQYADAETLHLEASPCPPSLPHEACFGSVASQTLDWGSYSPALPLETTVRATRPCSPRCAIPCNAIPIAWYCPRHRAFAASHGGAARFYKTVRLPAVSFRNRYWLVSQPRIGTLAWGGGQSCAVHYRRALRAHGISWLSFLAGLYSRYRSLPRVRTKCLCFIVPLGCKCTTMVLTESVARACTHVHWHVPTCAHAGIDAPIFRRPTTATQVGYVQSLLQSAIEVEHSTIPLYLTTGYSIMNQSSFEVRPRVTPPPLKRNASCLPFAGATRHPFQPHLMCCVRVLIV